MGWDYLCIQLHGVSKGFHSVPNLATQSKCVSSCTVSQVSNYLNMSYQRQDRLVACCETGTLYMMAMFMILRAMQREAQLNEIEA